MKSNEQHNRGSTDAMQIRTDHRISEGGPEDVNLTQEKISLTQNTVNMSAHKKNRELDQIQSQSRQSIQNSSTENITYDKVIEQKSTEVVRTSIVSNM